jgi:hypothetical protein
MRDFEDSTLWRISAFERMRNEDSQSGFARQERTTMLPSTLLADFERLNDDLSGLDALEVMAACLRHQESALLYLTHEELVWPITLFPAHSIYHCPRDISTASNKGLEHLKLVEVEPPGVRPPGHWMHERVGQASHYCPLTPLLWRVALYGPRGTLLTEIGGTAAYRALVSVASHGLIAPGAMGSAAERLHRQSVSMREVASWPGMSVERASRLLNALYLAGSLMVTRSHPAARHQFRLGAGFSFGFRKSRR